jgi:hypothetical protein
MLFFATPLIPAAIDTSGSGLINLGEDPQAFASVSLMSRTGSDFGFTMNDASYRMTRTSDDGEYQITREQNSTLSGSTSFGMLDRGIESALIELATRLVASSKQLPHEDAELLYANRFQLYL